MYKISKHWQLNAWRIEIAICTGIFFLQNNIIKMDPSARNLQESGNKQNKVKKKISRTFKLCTLATNNLIFR